MASSEKMPVRRSKRQAMEMIRRCLSEGKFIYDPHIYKQAKKRKFTIGEVLHVLRTGVIKDEPEPHIRTNLWRYRVCGETPLEKKLTVVVEISDPNTIIITCF